MGFHKKSYAKKISFYRFAYFKHVQYTGCMVENTNLPSNLTKVAFCHNCMEVVVKSYRISLEKL